MKLTRAIWLWSKDPFLSLDGPKRVSPHHIGLKCVLWVITQFEACNGFIWHLSKKGNRHEFELKYGRFLLRKRHWFIIHRMYPTTRLWVHHYLTLLALGGGNKCDCGGAGIVADVWRKRHRLFLDWRIGPPRPTIGWPSRRWSWCDMPRSIDDTEIH